MTEHNYIDVAINFFESYLSNEGYEIGEFSIDEKYLKAIFLGEVYNQNSLTFVDEISDSTKDKIGLQSCINDSTISGKKNELEDYEFIRDAAERTVYLLLCYPVEVPAFILINHDLDPDKQIYYSRSQTQTGLRNWVDELITVLSPLSEYYDCSDQFVQDVGFCAHCALLDTAPTGARNTVDWAYPRSNIPKGSAFMQRIKQMNNPTQKFHARNPTELTETFNSCFNNFIALASDLGYYESNQQVAIDTTYIPTGAGAPDDLTVGGSSSSMTSEKYGERRWIYQISTTIMYPSKFVLSVEPLYDKSNKNLRLEPQLRHISNLDIDIDTIVCDAGYYGTKSIRELRKHQPDWIVRAEVRGDSDITQLVNEVQQSGSPDFETEVEISEPPLTPKPDAIAYPLSDVVDTTEQDAQVTFSDLALTDDDNGDDKELFTDRDPKEEILAYVVGEDIDDATMRKTQVVYRTRKRTESMFGQIKENCLVDTESHDPAVRYYTVAMGCMFYNFHYLINRTLSPQYGIPSRNTPMQEWLSVIKDIAFSV
jgi:hypothetical protein